MGSLEKRVEKLETAMVGGPPGCKECGHGGGGPARIVFGGALKEGEVFEPEFCSECGEQLSFTMVFDKPNQRDELDLELEELLDGR